MSGSKNKNTKKKILIAGNHDNFFKFGFPQNYREAHALKEVQSFLEEQKEMDNPHFEYLCDSGTEFQGLKIWGSPWTPWFKGVHPKCKAFMDTEKKIAKKFDLIPEDTDILITHSPPYGVLDVTTNGKNVGSMSLGNKVAPFKNLKLWVCGHIHEGYGYINARNGCKIVNVSHVNENYQPVNPPVQIVLERNFVEQPIVHTGAQWQPECK